MARFTWREVPSWRTLVVIGLVALVGVFVAVRLIRLSSEQTARLAQLTAENRNLLAKVEQLTREAEAAGARPLGAEQEVARASRSAGAMSQEVAQTLDHLRESLAEADNSIKQLRLRSEEQEARIQELSADNQRLEASETSLKEELASAKRLIDAVQAELQSKSEQLAQLEADSKKSRQRSAADSQKVAQVLALVGDLQEVNRRRENYLSTILRRYKDVTQQYRAFYGVLEARSHSEGGGIGGADLSRMQNAISMAEEDMRQLESLNAQASRIERKMAGK